MLVDFQTLRRKALFLFPHFSPTCHHRMFPKHLPFTFVYLPNRPYPLTFRFLISLFAFWIRLLHSLQFRRPLIYNL